MIFERQDKVLENLKVEDAIEQLLIHTRIIQETETVDLLSARGRILAEDMKAGLDNPPFDRSPIDGYACKSEDLTGAAPGNPVTLKVIREIDAGQYYDGMVQSGEAVRIMTGAAIPKGCDCCVKQEDTDYGEDRVQIYRSMKQWENYCFQGEDFKKGTVLLRAGTKLDFVEIGILASMGVAEVPVRRRARAAILTTGDEVMIPGEQLKQGKIYDCNQSLLAARLMDFGAELIRVDKIADCPEDMTKALEGTVGTVDMIITTGAVSVGKKDIMHEALKELGAERIFWRIEMKPGMPTLFSVYKDTPILSLSGNPFGAVVSADVLIRCIILNDLFDLLIALSSLCDEFLILKSLGDNNIHDTVCKCNIGSRFQFQMNIGMLCKTNITRIYNDQLTATLYCLTDLHTNNRMCFFRI